MFSLLRFSAVMLLFLSGIAYSVPYTFEYSSYLTSLQTTEYDLENSVHASLNTDLANRNGGSNFIEDQFGNEHSFAAIQADAYNTDASLTSLPNRSERVYQLDFVKLVAVNVPEPDSLFLPLIGLLALLLGRRLKTR